MTINPGPLDSDQDRSPWLPIQTPEPPVPVEVSPLPVLSYRGVVEANDFDTLGRFRSAEAGQLAAKLEAVDIRALIVINPAAPSEVELHVPAMDVDRALEVIALPDHLFLCPACGSLKHSRMPLPARAQVWRLFACCLFVLPIACLLILNQRNYADSAEQWRTIVQLLTVPIGIIALLILREVGVRFPRRFRCSQCSYLWLPD